MARVENDAEQAEVVILCRHIRIAIRELTRVFQNIPAVIAPDESIVVSVRTGFLIWENLIHYLLLSEPVTIEPNPDKGGDCRETTVTSSVIFWNSVILSIVLLLVLH